MKFTELNLKTLLAGTFLLLWICEGLMASSVTLTNGTPLSGIIRRISSTTSFNGFNTREESFRAITIPNIDVTGDTNWSAYPDIGRVVAFLRSSPSQKSYPEETRRAFSAITGTNATKLGDEVFKGFPCWKYLMIRPRRQMGDIVFMGTTNLCLFLANPDFPLIIRGGSPTAWNTNYDVIEIRLDCPVSPDLFVCPTNLKPTRPFHIPAIPLKVDLRQMRHSIPWGWTNVATNFLSSDGTNVTRRYFQIHTDVNGEHEFAPASETKPLQQGVIDFNSMAPPFWPNLRKIGDDTVLGMKADVLDDVALNRRYWVVDHPILGTFSAKWSEGGDTPETNEVLRLEIRP
jgi:hypothetical protein